MNVIDYLASYGSYSFDEVPFNDVDNLVMSHITYIDWTNVLSEKEVNFSDACELYFKNNKIVPQKMNEWALQRRVMLALMANSNRYSKLKVSDYVNDECDELEKDFCAMTIKVKSGLYYVSYKGTGTNIIGWKEDFNMAYLFPIPSQKEAKEYLIKAMKKSGSFMVGGHSKGGNLAVYAAVMVNDDRIISVYNNDGPGFNDEFMNKPNYQNMLSRMKSIIPESSIVGLLLNSKIQRKIVLSDADSIIGQHNGLSWMTLQNYFVTVEELSEISKFVGEISDKWFTQLTLDEKLICIETIFGEMEKMHIKTTSQLKTKAGSLIMNVLKSFQTYDKETKSLLFETAMDLIKTSGSSLIDTYVITKLKHLTKNDDKK